MDRGLSYLIAQLLGEVVEGDFEDSNVQVGLWRGHICLENVLLRKSVFDSEKAPISLCHGSIGKIEIKIPWNNLGKEPVSVSLEDIFILVRPMYDRDTMEMRLQRDHRVKRAKLAATEVLAAEAGHDKLSRPSWTGAYVDYFSKYVAQKVAQSILSNIHLSITNVHIRYEDHVSCPTEFCFGLTLESLSLHSVKGVVDVEDMIAQRAGVFSGDTSTLLTSLLAPPRANSIHQIGCLDSLAIYCNIINPFSVDNSVKPFVGKSTSDIIYLMRSTIPTRRQRAAAALESCHRPRHDYIMRPLHVMSVVEVVLGASGVGSMQVSIGWESSMDYVYVLL